jgi:Spy/CpxP family protein refolding chaperone
MRRTVLFGLTAVILFSGAVYGTEREVRDLRLDLPQNLDDLGREMRDWLNRWLGRLGAPSSREERPLISLMLSHRDKLGLSADQVRQLERLRSDYEKESIRKDADLRIAEMDLQTLLDSPAVDMGKVESKVREIEKLRADLRLARIRAVEKGKEQLTSEQRQKLQELLGEPGAARRQPRNEPER